MYNPDRKRLLNKVTEMRSELASLRRQNRRLRQIKILLEYSKKRFSRMADLLPQTYFEMDRNGNITYVNKTGMKYFGYSFNEFEKGLNVMSLITRQDRAKVRRNIEKIMRGEENIAAEYTAVRKDKNTFPIMVYSSPIYENGRVVGVRGITADITRQKEREAAIKRHQLAIEASIDGIAILDEKLKHRYINGAYSGIYGYSSRSRLMKKKWISLYPPEEKKKIENIISEYISKTGSWRGEVNGRRLDGVLVPQEISINRFKEGEPGYVCVVRDITRRKKTEEKLFRSRQLLKATVRGMPLGVLLVNKKGVFNLMEGRNLSLIGVEKEKLIGKTLDETVKEIPKITSSLKRALNGEKTAFTIKRKIFCQLQCSPIYHNDKIAGAIAVAVDISRRIQAEYKLRRLNQELTEANLRLKEIDRLKSEFLTLASHEIKTPLTGIIGFARTLLNLKLTEEQRKRYLTIIETEGKRLASLIDDFLDISKIEIGVMKFRYEDVNLNDLIIAAVNTVRASKKINFKFRLAENIPPVTADRDRIEQVMINILDNAVKHTPEGKDITVTTFEYDKEVKVSIADQGPGVSKEDREKVFDKFFKVQPEHHKTGSGLGLSIAKEIINVHQGKIWMESAPGKGCKVVFTLPKKRNPQKEKVEFAEVSAK